MVKSPINFARLHLIFNAASVSYHHIDEHTARRIVGFVFNKRTDGKSAVHLFKKYAIDRFKLSAESHSGYSHIVGEYFNEDVDRFGRYIPKHKEKRAG